MISSFFPNCMRLSANSSALGSASLAYINAFSIGFCLISVLLFDKLVSDASMVAECLLGEVLFSQELIEIVRQVIRPKKMKKVWGMPKITEYSCFITDL